MATISDFKAQLQSGGARSNQFKIVLNFPSGVAGNDVQVAASFLCNATSLPASTIANIPVSFRGRPVNFAGEREFAPWNITVLNDGDFQIRDALERWSHLISNYQQTNGTMNPNNYQVDMEVHQLDRNSNVLKQYKFFDAFPTEIGEITLSYETPEIETFDVTFQYNYFAPLNIV